MLLKSLTDALRKQKQSNAALEAKLSQASQRKQQQQQSSENDEVVNDGQFVGGQTAVKRLTANNRPVAPLAKAQLEVPINPIVPIRNNNLMVGGERATAYSSSSQPPSLVPTQIEAPQNLMKGAVTAPVGGNNKSSESFQNPLQQQSEESRDLLKRSFMMHKSTSEGGGGDIPNIMTRSSPPLLMANGRIESPTTTGNGLRTNQGKYVESKDEEEAQGFALGTMKKGPRGSRLNNNQSATKNRANKAISYESRLF
jgi:hypothetical protein